MFDVQILGAIILHQGRISEMKTGEGKTLTSTAAAFLNTLTGNPTHIVTVNDYLARRDAEWMEPVFRYLGISVGYVVPSLSNDVKKQMYDKDIVYATNNELGFDYLRDNLRRNKEKLVERGYHYCIIDEVDSILIDEARTPLIISGQAEDDTIKFKHSNAVIPFLSECKKNKETGEYPEEEADLEGDYKIQEKNKSVTFTNEGTKKIEQILHRQGIIVGLLQNIENFEYLHYVTQSLRAHTSFHKDVDYIMSENKVEIVDEFTGRVLHGRRYSDGLHQAIEAKEGIKVAVQNKTLASITFQNFFKMYSKLSGMTGTAVTEEKEFLNIYGIDVVELPTNKPVVRDDKQDLIFVDEPSKLNAIIHEIQTIHETGQPMLIGTASIENSEKLSEILTKKRIKHNVLNAKNNEREAFIIAEAGRVGSITIATNMAGRGTDIKLGGNPDFKVQDTISDTDSQEEQQRIRQSIFEQWRQDYEKVRSLGGLYVLGTERHESRRIDNQLRGRSGRQGDAGVSQFYLSLDDQLLKLFGGGISHLKNLMLKTMDASEPLYHPLITRTMQRAQKNVEDRNFEIRKHLLDFDSVLNSQRNIIYTEREKILSSDTLLDRMKQNLEEFASQFDDKKTETNMSEVIEVVKTTFHTQSDLSSAATTAELSQMLYDDLQKKEELVGNEMFNELIRVQYLQLIDIQWQKHISNLEELRQAVYLRSYAQKNPLLEYKLEASTLFNAMFNTISHGILRTFVGMSINKEHTPQQNTGRATLQTQTTHKNFSLFQNTPLSSGNQGRSQGARPQQAAGYTAGQGAGQAAGYGAGQMQRNASISQIQNPKKVGRNEPCPCGSGKKYKYCHGSAG